MKLVLALLLVTNAEAWMPTSRRFAASRVSPCEAIAVFGGSGGVGSEVSADVAS
jgi:NADPH:quinone reductase-like Zn-dependent oxidoreductase